ncbi:hypothetical protein FQN50_007152 [Emmonsiellopsis sp. PD_5]|nr:hypothetical protein FQN50_007152 [Emmonsiellopsis sp. PD_5]
MTPSCSRCTRKGIQCVYDRRPGRRQRVAAANTTGNDPMDGLSRDINPTGPVTPVSVSIGAQDSGDSFTGLEMLGSESIWDERIPYPLDESSQADQIWSTIPPPKEGELLDLVHRTITTELDSPFKLATTWLPQGTLDWSNPAFSTSDLAIQPKSPSTNYLSYIAIHDPTAQRNASYILQMLRSFPQMMMRKATFPPFIHSQGYGKTNHPERSLPEPIGNCMSLVQSFYWRTAETKEFVWKMIRKEQCRLSDEAESFDKENLLAAIQAYIIYVIMRVIDSDSQREEDDRTILFSFQKLSECFRKRCGTQTFSVTEQCRTSHTWQDWIFEESRRRAACIWFLLGRIIYIKTRTPCHESDAYQMLPLPSSRWRWEARSYEDWKLESEYPNPMGARHGFVYFGELLNAQQQPDDMAAIHKMDSWNSEVDGLGTMLMLATAMV